MGKKKNTPVKEDIAEEVCFVCKDGGDLRVCDFKNCLKSYHPLCVGHDQSFMETDERWVCGWHSCFICKKGSEFQCHCCPTSICARCIGDAEFVTVKKGKKGFCINCLKLAILAEENAEVDSKGRKVDFQDKQTYEYFFKEYLVMVNKTEGLTLEDLHTADSRLKRGEIIENESDSDADEFLEEELDSDIDGGSGEKYSVMKTPKQRSGTRKINYISWDPDEILGEGDNRKKRQKVHCDSDVPSELNHCMRIVSEQSKSKHAAIVEKNINSLYLRKTLVLKLLNDPETFESKVTGCFVRVKKDRKDFIFVPSIPYQLGQVKGTKKASHTYTIGDTNIDVVLCITNMKDIQISMLSDDDIEEDECDDLRQMVKKGLFQKPTIAELDRKIKSMHRDIMNHWIDREVLRLNKMIDRANEKGWRAQLFDYIERRELLRTPKEKTRLLEEIPDVIAEMEDEPVAVQETPLMDVKERIASVPVNTLVVEANDKIVNDAAPLGVEVMPAVEGPIADENGMEEVAPPNIDTTLGQIASRDASVPPEAIGPIADDPFQPAIMAIGPHLPNSTSDAAVQPEYPPHSPTYSSNHNALSARRYSYTDIMQDALDKVAHRVPLMPQLNADVADINLPRVPPEIIPQAISPEVPQTSIPSVNTGRRKGKEPMSEFLPVTPDGTPVTKDSDHEDIDVIQGLLESTFLNGHLEFYRSNPGTPLSLLNSGIKGIYWGLSDLIQAMKVSGEKFLSAKAQISSLQSKLADADKTIAAQKIEMDNMRSALTYASRSGVDEIERQFATYRGASERTICDLQKELQIANAKAASYAEQLGSSREARVGLQMENDQLHSEVHALKDYSTGVQHRHMALMILLANVRTQFQEWIDERRLIMETNQALRKALVDMENVKAEHKLMVEELEKTRLRATKHSETLAKLIAESGRMDPLPANVDPTDPRRFLLEAWHPEEARLREELANLQTSVPKQLHQRLQRMAKDSFDKAMQMATDSFNEGYRVGYNQGRDRTIANSTDIGRLGAEVDTYLDNAISMLSEGNPKRIEEALKALQLARELSAFGSDILCFQNR